MRSDKVLSAGRWAGPAALAFGSVVLTLLVVDIAFVLFWEEPVEAFIGTERYPSNPRGYYTPDGDGGFELVTDRSGYACELPPDHDDIVFIGDSFTFGQGVRSEHTFAARVADAGHRVRNCGVRGYNYRDLIGQLQGQVVNRPALVVYSVVLNDMCGDPRAKQVEVETPGLTPTGSSMVDDAIWTRPAAREVYVEQTLDDLAGWSFLQHSAIFRFFHRRWALADLDRATREVYHRCWAPSALLERQFDDFADYAQRFDRFIVFIWPLMIELDDYPFAQEHQVIRQAFERRNVPVMDLLPLFEGQDADALIVHPLDRHPNEIAHAMAAEAMLPLIEQQLKMPSRRR